MNDEDLRQEMADMRKGRSVPHAEKESAASDKAQAAREARMAKMTNKEAGDTPDLTAEEATAVATPPALMAEHTVASGDTLSHIAQKYYNSAAHWQAIYEANKETIGDNPSLIRIGQVLKIPALSD